MLKYSSLILLVAVAVFWSSADAKPRAPLGKRALAGLYKRSPLAKRDTGDNEVGHSSEEEMTEELAKELLVGLLLLTVDNSAEQDALAEKFKEALDTKWDNIDDFGNHVVKVYEEVTGQKLEQSSEEE